MFYGFDNTNRAVLSIKLVMNISDIIAPDRVVCDLDATSKKRVLERLSDMLVTNSSDTLASQDVVIA